MNIKKLCYFLVVRDFLDGSSWDFEFIWFFFCGVGKDKVYFNDI